MARPAGRGRSVLGAGDPLGLLPAGRCGGKAAETGLTQVSRQRAADLPHGIDDLIDRDAAPDTGNGHVRRAHGVDRADDGAGCDAAEDGDADAMAIGPNAKASSVKALAIGNNVSASGTLSIAIGTASNPSTDTTTAETPHPTSSEGTSSVAIGTSAIAQTNDSIAIGTRAATYTANTTSTPVSTVGVQSVAIGFSA